MQAAITKIEKGSPASSSESMGLEAANTGLSSALRVVEGSDRTIPSQAIELYRQSDEAAKARIAEWTKLKSTELPRLNDALRKAGRPANPDIGNRARGGIPGVASRRGYSRHSRL